MVSSVVSAAQVITKELTRIAVINFNSITARFLPKKARLPFENGMKSSWEEIIEPGSIIVQDGLIKEVGVDINSTDAPSISCPGHTLLPGLIDAHCHPYGDIKLLEEALRFGITTSMDMHNMPWKRTK